MTNGELTHELMLQLLRTRTSFRQALMRTFKRNNIEITFEMVQLMHCLWHEQGISQQCLAEKTAKDKACMTSLLNNLEKKGWVKRLADPSDGRNRLVYFTEEGEALSNRMRPLIGELYSQAGEKMNDKQLAASTHELIKLNEILDNL